MPLLATSLHLPCSSSLRRVSVRVCSRSLAPSTTFAASSSSQRFSSASPAAAAAACISTSSPSCQSRAATPKATPTAADTTPHACSQAQASEHQHHRPAASSPSAAQALRSVVSEELTRTQQWMARWLSTSHPALQHTVDLTLARPGKAIRPALTLLVHRLATPSCSSSATAPHLRPLQLQELPHQCRAELSTLHEDPTRLLDLYLPSAFHPLTTPLHTDTTNAKKPVATTNTTATTSSTATTTTTATATATAVQAAQLNGALLNGAGPSLDSESRLASAVRRGPAFESEQAEPAVVMLAGVVEMIHTASLVHDDVVDRSDTRRGGPSVASEVGSQHAVLAGDYLLARASVALARIGEPRVTALMSAALASLVEGEFLQLDCADPTDMHAYVRKCYHKTASLFAHACQSAALLAGADPVHATAAASFGRHLGLAFQVTDDLLDLTSSASTLGKPCGADLELGLATAPVLYALRCHPSLRPLIMRRFQQSGDVETALRCVHDSDAFERTAQLASYYGDRAQRDLEV
eukprot:CAMPEP_0177661230 /NCGR_PEP_ID=MMETSP0447-20121125/18548_1 /TAXON_ID=0 /ORGANISM="Stygamoeba regulata, Strain BSH-02190019" /LENGTH=524 /DNA_ID=CAMNT_0019166519 /DNA_START=31 /DNA_END=1602 /DNA_ORIENTATION=+